MTETPDPDQQRKDFPIASRLQDSVSEIVRELQARPTMSDHDAIAIIVANAIAPTVIAIAKLERRTVGLADLLGITDWDEDRLPDW